MDLWHPEFKHLGIYEAECEGLSDLFDWIEADGLMAAWNASFERCIWGNILAPRFGWPAVPVESWRCSAAQAAALALPRALGDAGAALGLDILKDDTGHKVMLKVSRPRKSRKKERETWEKTGETPPALLWHESRELFDQLFAYCKQDILSEEALSNAIPPLSTDEVTVSIMDAALNDRGFQIDRKAVSTGLTLIAKEVKKLNGELAELTGGAVLRATQRAKMKVWFAIEGLELDNTQKETIDAALVSTDVILSPSARRGLEIVRTLGRSSTAKFKTMQLCMDPTDSKIRGSLLYHGASTGRWAGKGVQPQNFPKGTLVDPLDPSQPANLEIVWDALKSGDIATIDRDYKGVMECLSGALRGTIVSSPGTTLYVADYASIEARVVMWLAGDESALEMFRTPGADIYKDMAAAVYVVDICDVTKAQRNLGKQAILGCGFGMGAPKFVATCAKFGIIIDEDFSKLAVDSYRAKYWRVKQLWGDQESAAISAVQSRRRVDCGYASWVVEGSFLFCELPSGRRLAYPYPQIKSRETPWGEMRNALTFMGVNTRTKKWDRQHTYGGSIVENITQAVARDCMAEAMLRCEASGYPVILSVHDEILSEAATGNLKQFEGLMSEVPDWADGLPIAVEGFAATRYRK